MTDGLRANSDCEVLQEREAKQTVAGDWRAVRLGDLIEIKHGFAFKGLSIRDDPQGDVLLTPRNFAIGGGFKRDTFKYYDGPVPEDFVLREGDFLVTMTDLSKQSDTLGYPALVPPRMDGRRYLHNQRLGKIAVKEVDEVSAKYIYYVMCTNAYRNEVLASATGTTVKHTSPDRIRRFRFLLPPLPEQRAIAHVLGALDNKIELNRRMNETLEAMARALFKDWFVVFGPVRAKLEARKPYLPPEVWSLFPDRLVDSEIGEMPEGWEVKALGDVIDVNPRRSIRRGDMARHVEMAALPTSGPHVAGWTRRAFTSGSRFTLSDTLLARITPSLENGKTAFVDFLDDGETGWGSTEFIVLRPRPPWPPEIAYLIVRDTRFREHATVNMTGTSGRQRVPTEAVSSYTFAAPSDNVPVAFGEFVHAWFERATYLAGESRDLAVQRDALLPRLVSGKLRMGVRT